MVKINLICVGKVKEKYFADGITEYAKRLKRFCDFRITEVEEENVKDGNFSVEGEKFSSEKLAKEIKTCSDAGQGVITFVIGGSYGISDEVKAQAYKLVSFSDLTFPHTLFRLIATEQIYRAFTIINGTPYHK